MECRVVKYERGSEEACSNYILEVHEDENGNITNTDSLWEIDSMRTATDSALAGLLNFYIILI